VKSASVRLRWLVAALVLLGIAAAALWSIPGDDFLFTPDPAKPLAERVQVEGAKPAAAGDVYYVDVFVRRATLLEQFLPFTQPQGSTLVPEHSVQPPGTTDEERRAENTKSMQRSELVASAVALRALGRNVTATPTGVRVVGVAVDAPAAGKLHEDDLVVAVDGQRTLTVAELRAAIGTRSPGAPVRLTVKRDDAREDLTMRTIPDPGAPSRPIVGIQVDQGARIELPLDVDIDLGQVGGPSAGLPFALEIARMLGRNVTHGCRIAATGQLALDGSVLPVGGLKQKTIGVRRADVDLFLVPAGDNYDDARDNADSLRVVPVKSFQQALRTLATDPPKC
jgi:PDZ domain-containing protein